MATKPADDVISATQGHDGEAIPGLDNLQVEKKYGEERAKRLRDDGDSQFIDITLDPKYQAFLEDPWVEDTPVKDASTMFIDHRCEMLVVGAGLGGLVYAVRMVQAGVDPNDIRILDTAGGFGGTWYHNRFPNLTCDVESYMYLPLLEETGYMPRHRYSYSEEIRNYANLVAKKWGLYDNAVFRTKPSEMVWDEESKEWAVKLTQAKKGEQPQTLDIRTRFVVMATGVLNRPKLPSIPGILSFEGDIFHSARWNYSVTGGSPSDPSLTKLQGKCVAIIGTGVTSVQIMPILAQWAKHVYVVQRTPASIDYRGQRATDPEWFRKNVATSAGWQRERLRNFHQHHTTGKQPAVNLVDDAWTHAIGMVAAGGNSVGPKSMDEVPGYLQKLRAIDMERQNRLRKRVEQEVKDPNVAKKLMNWYPSWCKRPGFSDEYLQVFNRENVTLVDTDGKGLDRITNDSIVHDGQSYPVDVIVCATGYQAPFVGSPAANANVKIIGRNGLSMSEEWRQNGPSTLHGILDHNFPNLFLSSSWQGALSPNNLCNIDVIARNAAYVLSEAKRRANGKPFSVTTTAAGAEQWGDQIMMHSFPMAAMAGCTPSYWNAEGDFDRVPQEMQAKMARSGIWGHGLEDFDRVLGEWRREGSMDGIEVQVV